MGDHKVHAAIEFADGDIVGDPAVVEAKKQEKGLLPGPRIETDVTQVELVIVDDEEKASPDDEEDVEME